MSENNLRKRIFWLQDRLKGGIIKKFYDDMMNFYENGIDEEKRHVQLDGLLKHAVETTDCYSKFSGYSDLSDFPVITKEVLRDKAKFFSSKFRGRKDNRMVCTSGSTGVPLSVYHDPMKVARTRASVAFFGHLTGYKIGMRQANFGVWYDIKEKSRFDQLKQNMLAIDISRMNDEKIEEICRKLNNRKVESILGYASTLDEISRYIMKHRPELKFPYVKTVVSSAEALQNITRSNLNKIFDCPIMSRYSNTENGIIAHQLAAGDECFYIDSSSYIVEMLKLDSNERAQESELGRIVLTDLYNFAFPMIRYDTGDMGIMTQKNGKCCFQEVFGRRMDLIYGVNGEILSPFIFDFINEHDTNVIRQYQFIQEGAKEYRLKINVEPGLTYHPESAIQWFKSYLGEEAEIVVEYVDEIPVLSSGKRKIFENHWNKTYSL